MPVSSVSRTLRVGAPSVIIGTLLSYVVIVGLGLKLWRLSLMPRGEVQTAEEAPSTKGDRHDGSLSATDR